MGSLPCSILQGLLQGCSYFCFLINQIVTWRDLSYPSPVVTYFKRGPVLSAKGRIQICQTNHRHPKVLQAVDYGDGVWWVECLGKRQGLEVPDGSLSWSTAWILRRFMVKGMGLVALLRRKLVSPCLSERYMETQRCWSRLLWPLCWTTGFPTRNGWRSRESSIARCVGSIWNLTWQIKGFVGWGPYWKWERWRTQNSRVCPDGEHAWHLHTFAWHSMFCFNVFVLSIYIPKSYLMDSTW